MVSMNSERGPTVDHRGPAVRPSFRFSWRDWKSWLSVKCSDSVSRNILSIM